MGYLRNQETRNGYPSQLVVGDPMPEDTGVFPSPEELKKYILFTSSVHDATPQHYPEVFQKDNSSQTQKSIDKGE